MDCTIDDLRRDKVQSINKMDCSKQESIVLVNIMCNYVRQNYNNAIRNHTPGRRSRKLYLRLYQKYMLPVVQMRRLQENPTPCTKLGPKQKPHNLRRNKTLGRKSNSGNVKNSRVLTDLTHSSQVKASGCRNGKRSSRIGTKRSTFVTDYQNEPRISSRHNSKVSTEDSRNKGQYKKQTKHNGHRVCATIYKFLKHHKYLQSKLLPSYNLMRAKQSLNKISNDAKNRVKDNETLLNDNLSQEAVCRSRTRHKLNGKSYSPTSQVSFQRRTMIKLNLGTRDAKCDDTFSDTSDDTDPDLSMLVPKEKINAIRKTDTPHKTKHYLKDARRVLKPDEEYSPEPELNAAHRDQIKSQPADYFITHENKDGEKTINEHGACDSNEVTSTTAATASLTGSNTGPYNGNVSETTKIHENCTCKEYDKGCADKDVVLDVIGSLVGIVENNVKSRRSSDNEEKVTLDYCNSSIESFLDAPNLAETTLQNDVKTFFQHRSTKLGLPPVTSMHVDALCHFPDVICDVRELMNDILRTICTNSSPSSKGNIRSAFNNCQTDDARMQNCAFRCKEDETGTCTTVGCFVEHCDTDTIVKSTLATKKTKFGNHLVADDCFKETSYSRNWFVENECVDYKADVDGNMDDWMKTKIKQDGHKYIGNEQRDGVRCNAPHHVKRSPSSGQGNVRVLGRSTETEDAGCGDSNDDSDKHYDRSCKRSIKIESLSNAESEKEDILPDILPVDDVICKTSPLRETPIKKTKRQKPKFPKKKRRSLRNTRTELKSGLRQCQSRGLGVKHSDVLNSLNHKKRQRRKRKVDQERRKIYPRRESIFYSSDFIYKTVKNESVSKGTEHELAAEDDITHSVTDDISHSVTDDRSHLVTDDISTKQNKLENEEQNDIRTISAMDIADSDGRLSIEFSNHNWLLEKHKLVLQDDINKNNAEITDRVSSKKRTSGRPKKKTKMTASTRKFAKTVNKKNQLQNEMKLDFGNSADSNMKCTNGSIGYQPGTNHKNVSNNDVPGEDEPIPDLHILEVVSLAKYVEYHDDSMNSVRKSELENGIGNDAVLNGENEQQCETRQNWSPMKDPLGLGSPDEIGSFRSADNGDIDKPLDLSFKSVLPLDLSLNVKSHTSDSDGKKNSNELDGSLVPSVSYACFNLPTPNPVKGPTMAALVPISSEQDLLTLPDNTATHTEPSGMRISPSRINTSSNEADIGSVHANCGQIKVPNGRQTVRHPFVDQNRVFQQGTTVNVKSPDVQRAPVQLIQPDIISQTATYPAEGKRLSLDSGQMPTRTRRKRTETGSNRNPPYNRSNTVTPASAVPSGSSFARSTTYIQNQPHAYQYPSMPPVIYPLTNGQSVFNPLPAVPYESQHQASASNQWRSTFELNGHLLQQQRQRESSYFLNSGYNLPYYGQLPSTAVQYSETGNRNVTGSRPSTANKAGSYQSYTVKCQTCSNRAVFLCSRCRKVAYCSRHCQFMAWKHHRNKCLP